MFLSKNANGESAQLFATNVGNILCLSFGVMFGITPKHSNLYTSEATPLNRMIDSEASTWLAGFLFLSAVFGAIFFGYLTSKIGPKAVLLFSGILQLVSWFCIHFAYDIIHIYSSRIFAGAAGGAAFVVLPIFVIEISEPLNYTQLLGSIDQSRSLGILLGFLMAKYLPYPTIPVFGLCVTLIFCLICPFIKESPYYFLRKGNVPAMEQSLRWFRGIRKVEDQNKKEFISELNDLKNEIQGNTGIGDFQMSRCYRFKLLSICIVLTIGAQLSGLYIILNDGGSIFGKLYSSSTFDVDQCVLILSLSQLIGSTIFRWIHTKLKRKILLTLSAVICGISTISFALLRSILNPDTIIYQQSINLYIGFVALHFMCANIGVNPLSLIIPIELTPAKIRTKINIFTTALSQLLLFILVKYFNTMNLILKDTAVWFWLFGAVSIFTALFAFILLPETSGKSSYEVQQTMGYSSNSNIAKITTITNGRINNNNI